jgi:hypothetical protein
MDFTSRYPIRKLTVLAQDPAVLNSNGKALTITVPVPDESLTPGPKGHRIHIVDFDSSENRYYAPRANDPYTDRYAKINNVQALVGDRDFHAQNTYGHVATTLAQFESALGRHVNWAFDSGAHHIKVAPHAFLDTNAFYSRRDEALCFGYFAIDTARKAAKSRDYVYTCLSADIVTHETTHAIIDGLRRELMRPSTPDQPAFHEGFADIVALLSSLSREELLRLVLPVKRAGGREIIAIDDLKPKALKQSVLIGLAEQFGRTLAAQNLINRGATALRRSAEIDPKKENYDTLLAAGAEAHELGEIIVAAVLNAFLEIWHARALTLDPVGSGFADRDRAIEDGVKAAQDLLHMAIRALDYLPPVNMTYRDFLSALITADREVAPGTGKYDYRRRILDIFALYHILPVTPDGYWLPPELPKGKDLLYGFSGYAEMMWDREAVMRFLWENRDALEVNADALTTVNFVKPSVRTGPDGFLVRETIVEYFQLLDVTGGDLKSLKVRKPVDMPSSAPVRLLGGSTLVFDDYGRLKFHIGSGVVSKRQNEHVSALWRAGPEVAGLRRFEVLHRQRMLGGSVRSEQGW